MTFLIHFLRYRIDSALFVLAALFGLLLCQSFLQHRRAGSRLPPAAWWLSGLFAVIGIGLAEWAGDARRQSLQNAVATLGPTYAFELQKLGHASITPSTPPDDPAYLALIAAQKDWLRLNPFIADIYTFRRLDDRRVALIVDSETDYNRNGVFDGDREARTTIGEPYAESSRFFFQALAGHANFDLTVQTDRWGVWVSSLTPIYDDRGEPEAAVGIDYPAADWIGAIATSRALVLVCALVLIAISLSRLTLLTLMRGELDDRANAQHELHRAKDVAEQANQAKSEFLAIMSHEIRTPLTAVMGFASVLSETRLDPTQRRYVETIISAGDRLVALLNDVLDLTKIEEGKLALESFAYSPTLLVNEVMDRMTVPALEKGLNLRCENQLSDSLALEGDPARIRQIILNLVSNAVKFTDHGDVTLRAAWMPPATPGDTGKFTLQITDTGIGIPSEKIPTLFKQFSQTHGSSRRYNGAGLGLAICKRLVDLMGGTIEVRSSYGYGSDFKVELPCVPATQLPLNVSSVAADASSAPPMRGRALVVDDQTVNRELLKLMLRRQGFLADIATCGEDAVSLAARNPYTIIFMDLEMPGLGGLNTATQIRANERAGNRVPIVAVTATTTKGTREKCLAAGMDEYLTKPVYLPALKSTLAAMTESTVT